MIEKYYTICFDSEEISCSSNHRFWRFDKAWVRADELKVGDYVYSQKGWTLIRSIIENNNKVEVYNIVVGDNQNYVVGHGGYLVIDRWPAIKPNLK